MKDKDIVVMVRYHPHMWFVSIPRTFPRSVLITCSIHVLSAYMFSQRPCSLMQSLPLIKYPSP